MVAKNREKVQAARILKQPWMRMVTPIYHPRIGEKGNFLCLYPRTWTPAVTLAKDLLVIYSLLKGYNIDLDNVNNPDNRYRNEEGYYNDLERCSLLDNEPEKFEEKAREWTARFAGEKADVRVHFT